MPKGELRAGQSCSGEEFWPRGGGFEARKGLD
jgi:hypothetical protein